MISVKQIEQQLYALAPGELQQSWDNVGLLVGSGEREVYRVLVALDITEQVVAEAVEGEYELIVAHHPLMNCHWSPVQSLTDRDYRGRLITALIEHHIAAICMHTNLDSAPGGVNDALAQAVGLNNTSVLCETEALGRVGTLAKPMTLPDFLALLKRRLGSNGIRFAAGGQMDVSRVAVAGGSCSEYISLAAEKGCDTFVTADIKYHDFQKAEQLGIHLIDAGHFPTEDVVCQVLIDALRGVFPELTVVKSTSHKEVIQYFV